MHVSLDSFTEWGMIICFLEIIFLSRNSFNYEVKRKRGNKNSSYTSFFGGNLVIKGLTLLETVYGRFISVREKYAESDDGNFFSKCTYIYFLYLLLFVFFRDLLFARVCSFITVSWDLFCLIWRELANILSVYFFRMPLIVYVYWLIINIFPRFTGDNLYYICFTIFLWIVNLREF